MKRIIIIMCIGFGVIIISGIILFGQINPQFQNVSITPVAFTTKIEIDWGDGKGFIDLSNFGGRNMLKELGNTVLPKFFGREYYMYEGEVRAVFAIPNAKCMITVSYSSRTKKVLVYLPTSLEKYKGHINSCGVLALTKMPKSMKHGYAMTYTKEGFIYILGPDGSIVIDTTCVNSLQKQMCAHFWMKSELVDSAKIIHQIGAGNIGQNSMWGGKVLLLTSYFELQKDYLKYEHFFLKDGRHERLEASLIDSLTIPIDTFNASSTDSTKRFVLPMNDK